MFLCLNFSIWLSTSEYLAGKAHLDYIEEEKMFELKNLNENREKKILEVNKVNILSFIISFYYFLYIHIF